MTDPEVYGDPETEWCHVRIGYGEFSDSCGETAVACDLQDCAGRCHDHVEEFVWVFAWGYVPKPIGPLIFLDTPQVVY